LIIGFGSQGVIELKQHYRNICGSDSQAYAFHRLIVNQDQVPVDFEFIEMNKAFETITGLDASILIGKTYNELFKDREDSSKYVEIFGDVALNGKPQYFDLYSKKLKRHFRGLAFSSEPMTFATLFSDITKEVHESKVKEIVFSSLNDIVFELDDELNFINVFTSDERHLFTSIDKLLVGSVYTLLPEDVKKIVLPTFEKAKVSLKRESVIYPWFINGELRWYRVVIIYTKIDEINRYIVSVNEFTKHKQDANIINESLSRPQQFIEHTKTFIWECDHEGLYTYVSDNVKEIIGYKAHELIKNYHFFDLHPGLNQKSNNENSEMLDDPKVIIDKRNEILTKAGEILSVSTTSFPNYRTDGSLKGYRGFDVDITETMKIDESIRLSEKKFRLITENTSDVIWVLSAKTFKTTYVSPSIVNLNGFTPEEVMGQRLEVSLQSDSFSEFTKRIEKGIREFIQKPETYLGEVIEIQLYCKDGSLIWAESSIKFRYDEVGDIEIVGVTRNIDHRKKVEKEIVYLSYHDQLTGVYNRSFYEEEVARLNTERNLPFTLVVCDIDGLKLTNDAFGHMAGDRLIVSLARILQRICRRDDIIARIGGDEFAILLPKTSEKVAQMLVRRILEEITLTKPERIKLSASFGWMTKLTLGEDFTEIYKQAEDRMYLEKIRQQSNVKLGFVKLITTSLFEKYPEEKKHAQSVSELCRSFGEALKLSNKEIADLEMAGLLHDIGKIGLDDELIKHGEYASFDESSEFKRHSEIGYQIIRSVFAYSHIAEFILSHHEWFNGSGYPQGLKEYNIPLQARIIKLANDFSSQIDREGFDIPHTLEFIKVRSGIQYDPALVEVLMKMFDCSPSHI
jgi:diguanylate cyclase